MMPDKAKITFPATRWGTVLLAVNEKAEAIEREAKTPAQHFTRTFQSEVVTSCEDLGDQKRITIQTRFLSWLAEALATEALKTALGTAQLNEKRWCYEASARLRRTTDPDIVTRIGQLNDPDHLLIDL